MEATPAVAEAEHVVDVMGTRAHVIVGAADLGTADVLGQSAVARLVALEQHWSRFLPGSEISNLNRNAGTKVRVSNDTLTLVTRAVEAWDRTDGRFDPTVLPALLIAGYDRDFRALRANAATPDTISPDTPRDAANDSEQDAGRHIDLDEVDPAPGCADIVISGNEIMLPVGTALDPGGIGKGLAADLVIDLLMTSGATGACINVGGDLRVAGTSPTGRPWTVDVEHPLPPHRTIGMVQLDNEALVSSWRTRRTWGDPTKRRHHLIDPSTGRPAWCGLAGVSVVAEEAWWAEALATAIFLAGPAEAPAIARRHGIGALLVRDDGQVLGIGSLRGLVDDAIGTTP